MNQELLGIALTTTGFMPRTEGLALHRAALEDAPDGPFLEIGSYCGRSAVFLGAAAAARATVLYSVDHHRGSEEHQPGEEYHDPDLSDPSSGAVDTLPRFAATIRRAGLTGVVLGIAARSTELAKAWRKTLGLVFIDGGHSSAAAHADYESWTPHLCSGGLLCIHDVFPDPAQGGRPPFEIYERALDSGRFLEIAAESSLRILRKR